MPDALDRIAAALERLAPPPPLAADPLTHPAYVWRDGVLTAARDFRPQALHALKGIDAQRDALIANLDRLAHGAAAQDMLLWGARGTGKSALVKAAVGHLQTTSDLALVEATGARVVKPYRLPLNLFDTSTLGEAAAPWLDRFRFFADVLDKIYSGIGPVQRDKLDTRDNRDFGGAMIQFVGAG